MNKDIFRKSMVLGIIFLFFGAGVFPSVMSGNNEPPIIGDPSPENGETDVSTDISKLLVLIEDPDSTFNWTIETSPHIGNSSGNNENTAYKHCFISSLENFTTYYWYVNATDGHSWTNVTYHFETGKGHTTYENYLGKITIKWSSPFFGEPLPITECEFENGKQFSFPETQGKVNMNFTIIYETYQTVNCLIPRISIFRSPIYYGDIGLYDPPKATWLPCYDQTPYQQIIKIDDVEFETGGEIKILDVYATTSGLPFGFIPEVKCNAQFLVNPI